MTKQGRCPACGGELRADARGAVVFHRCLSCAATVLDAETFDRLVPPDGERGPRASDRDYIAHYPQEDRGHARGRPQPPFAPPWASGGASGGADADGTALMFGP